MGGSDLIVVFFLVAVFTGIVCALVWVCLKKSPKSAEKFRKDYENTVQSMTSRLGRKIVEVKLLGSGSTDYRSFGGAVVGGMVAGPLGAVIGGAHGGKGKQRQRFAVKYDDGSVVIREVRAGSYEYNELMKYVSWEDVR